MNNDGLTFWQCIGLGAVIVPGVIMFMIGFLIGFGWLLLYIGEHFGVWGIVFGIIALTAILGAFIGAKVWWDDAP